MHIVNGYTGMTVRWMMAIFLLLTLGFFGIGALEIRAGILPVIEAAGLSSDPAVIVSLAVGDDLVGVVLRAPDGALLASNGVGQPAAFSESSLPVGFSGLEGKPCVFWTATITRPDGSVMLLRTYSYIGRLLGELVLMCGTMLLIMSAALLSIYLRGAFMTRRALGVIDELTAMAAGISSRNLNLRINTGNASEELVNLAITFNRMMDRIQSAYEKQNRFVSDASHELRTPISVIQGYARMLERWGKEDPAILEESIAAIRKESISMQDLVEKLLFIARNDRDTLVLIRKTFELGELVEEMVRDTQMLETGHEIDARIEPGIFVFADENRVKQALRVIVDNALKYTGVPGAISIKLAREGRSAVVSVRDSGIGIPEKDLSNIFDRFFRVDTARERNKGGHGLGLSIARIIVLRHGGKIRVASKPGEGTTFFIYFPTADAPLAPESASEREASQGSSETMPTSR